MGKLYLFNFYFAPAGVHQTRHRQDRLVVSGRQCELGIEQSFSSHPVSSADTQRHLRSPTCRTAFPTQRLRPSGVLSCWPDGLELIPGFYHFIRRLAPKPKNQTSPMVIIMKNSIVCVPYLTSCYRFPTCLSSCVVGMDCDYARTTHSSLHVNKIYVG